MINPVWQEQTNRQAEIAQFTSDLVGVISWGCLFLVVFYLVALWKQKRDKDDD